MKTIYKLLILAVISSGALFYSCETTELEILSSPNSLSDDQSDPDLLLNSIQRAYVSNMIQFNDRSSELTRIDYVGGRDYFAMYNSSILDGVWSNLYSTISPDATVIQSLQDDPENTNDYNFHLGVSRTLQAHQLMLMVDFLGDIPWSEALNPSEFPSPNVDDDATVYQVARGLLDIAMDHFNASGTVSETVTDFFYGSDIASWKKLVNTLKMRHALTVGDIAGFNSLVAAGNFISSTEDDFEFKTGIEQLNPNTQHQDYFNDYTSSGANIYQSNWLMRLMQGADAVNNSDDDPRMRYYFYRQTECTPGASCDPDGDGQFLQCSLETPPAHYSGIPFCYLEDGYWGRDHGDDDGTPPDNFLRTAVGVYPAGGLFDDSQFDELNINAGGQGEGIEPIILSSYVQFWMAEVALSSGDAGTAATLVQTALETSIAKVQGFAVVDTTRDTSFEPSAGAITAFIDAQVATITDTSADTWNAFAEQYFVTMYGGGSDAYNFYRRTGFPTTLKPNLEPNPGVFPRTFLYPSVEVVANPNITQRSDNATQVFWDTNPAGPAFPAAN